MGVTLPSIGRTPRRGVDRVGGCLPVVMGVDGVAGVGGTGFTTPLPTTVVDRWLIGRWGVALVPWRAPDVAAARVEPDSGGTRDPEPWASGADVASDKSPSP